MTSDSRDKMVRSAAALIGMRGLNATSFSDVVTASGAPRGSIYHYFPYGKRQLALCAMNWTSDQVLGHLETFTGSTAPDLVRHFIGLFRQVLVASDVTAGCAVAGVAVDIDDNSDMLEGANEIFQTWVRVLVTQLRAVGVGPERAEGLAILTLASVEGALILCRAERTVGPLDAVEQQLLFFVDA